MNNIFLNSNTKAQSYINGELIDDLEYDMEYDGNELDLAVKNNGNTIYKKLNNEDIMDLIDIKNNNSHSLLECLKKEFPVDEIDSNKNITIKKKSKSTTKKSKSTTKKSKSTTKKSKSKRKKNKKD